MKIQKILFVCSFFWTLVFPCCEAQNVQRDTTLSDPKVIKTNDITYVTQGRKHTINFPNGKVWEVAKNNPYNKLPFPIIRRLDGDQVNGYQVDSMIAPFTLPGEQGKIDTFFISPRYLRDTDLKVDYAQSSHAVTKSNKQCAAVCYSVYAVNVDNQVIGNRGCIYVFDSLGNIAREFLNLDIAPYGYKMALTEDGRYLAISYGGQYDEDDEGFITPGFQVYDVVSGAKIFDVEGGKESIEMTLPVPRGTETICIANNDPYSSGGSKQESLYYIFKNGKIYTKLLDFMEVELLTKTDESMSYKIKATGEIITETYENDFDKFKNQ